MTVATFLNGWSRAFIHICWNFLFSIVWLSSYALGFEVNTHRQLTEKAIESMESTLNAYLINNIGLEGGLNESVGGITARQWMIEGSEFEDEERRPRSHFHDPISDAGLTGLGE
ncbi:MAG: hypothetical protein OEW33_08405, partial [Nitrospirota bacterium]|nr:hypothetical protein [Nitrospirota bacterium]